MPPWWVATRREKKQGNPSKNRRAILFLATLIPISAVGLGLMGFNYARFDSPLEFGTTYQQFGQDLREIVQMSPAYLFEHSRQSLFRLPEFTPYFPFMTYQSEPLGALVLLPFAWFTVLLVVGWKAQRQDRSAFGALALALLIAPAGNLLMLACYYLAWARHHVDVVFPLCFAGAVGLLCATHAWRPHPWRRRTVAVVAPLLAAVNLAVTICFAATYPRQTGLPAAVERFFNAPVYLWEKLSGQNPSNVLQLNVTFAVGAADRRETLLKVGRDKLDVVFLHYLDNTRATLGFFHADLGAIESEPFLLQPGTPRVIELALGSLSPPAGHPAFTGWSRSAIEHTQRHLLVRLDGRTLFSQDILFHPASAGDRSLGSALPALNYLKFSGQITRTISLPLALPPRPALHWPAEAVTFEVVFSNRRIGRSEPLMSSGIRTAGDLLRVTYPDDAHLQLVLEHGTSGETLSPPIALPDDQRPHRITLRPEAATSRTSVLFDGDVVLVLDALPFPAAPETVYFGIQSFPANCEPVFAGRIDLFSSAPSPP